MKRSIFLFVLCSSLVYVLYAQKEASHWYFGENAGLDFSSGSLELDPSGLMDANHGSAVISDKDGNLLFYTNGASVWNKNHEIMPNGFLPDSNAGINTMQNCTIIPKVGEQNKFYVFTIETIMDGNKGLNYSIVDMSLDNNKGGITDTSIPVVDSLLVGCAVTRHPNKNDYWVVVRAITLVSNVWHEKWLSYLIDKNGIQLASSYLGNPLDLNTAQSGKFSPNGKYLYWGGNVYDFDNESGDIISYRSLVERGSSTYTNGEFSPNSDLIYVTSHGSDAFSIDQFDLNSSDLPDSKISIDIETDNISYMKGGLQLAPDGKIYVSYLKDIGVINSPNSLGVACGLEQRNINVLGKASWSFPNFSSHLFEELAITNTDEDTKLGFSINIFPNPARRFLNVDQSEMKFTKYELINADATLLYKDEITSQRLTIDISTIPQGIFWLKLSNEDSIVFKKVLHF